MKKIGTLAAAALMAAMTAGTAHAETWKCAFSGTWTEGTENGRFNWNVNWTAKGDVWQLSGRAAESFGRSDLNGQCDDKSCTLKQTYTSGELNGSVFHWRGSYTESFPTETTSVIKIRGTWGESLKNPDGTWSAEGKCALAG